MIWTGLPDFRLRGYTAIERLRVARRIILSEERTKMPEPKHHQRSFLFIILLLFTAYSSFAQTGSGLAFEVASIKPSALDMSKLAAQVRAGETPMIGPHINPSQATYTFMTLKELIINAYDVKPPQVIGPDWLSESGTQRFDIVAKLPDGATPAQAPQMLQALLAERFKLVVHRDTREQAVMALVVGGGGPKLKETTADELQDIDSNAPLKPGERQMDTSQGPVRMTVNPTGGATVNMGKRGIWTQAMQPGPPPSLHLEGKGVTMSAFADMLSQMTAMTGRGSTQVVDMTGLKGNYVVTMDFSMADLIAIAQSAGVSLPNASQQPGGGISAPDPGSSSAFEAVKALGLKLESRKAPQQQLIIDKVEKMPTAN
jgi:uncharacterized protein (TIGR03435 family)